MCIYAAGDKTDSVVGLKFLDKIRGNKVVSRNICAGMHKMRAITIKLSVYK